MVGIARDVFVNSVPGVFIPSFNDNRAKQESQIKINLYPAFVRAWFDYRGDHGLGFAVVGN
jgi:hypothetical protein